MEHLQSLFAVGEFIVNNGPIVSTQEAGHIYSHHKNSQHCKKSVILYEIFSKHLNLVQIYIHGKAYLLEDRGNDVHHVISTIKNVVNENMIINTHVEEKLKDIYKASLQYLDTPRDKQVLKGIISHITSVRFTAKLEGIQSRQGTDAANKKLVPQLQKFRHIQTSQTVRSDLTVEQQHRLIISARKLKEIKTIASGRGRKLKSTEFPQLAMALEYAFGENSRSEDSVGGLESHPRLTNGVLYRTSESSTTMKHARLTVLALAQPNFSISLSSCYNFTENYRRDSHQAKRHHAGRGVNAQISLKLPPRIGVEQLVVNLHWTTANVNHTVDSCNTDNTVIISKDAKAIIPGDIPAVQRPGHSWSRRMEYPDHTWDQSRLNAVTPMTFLVLDTKREVAKSDCFQVPLSNSTVMHVTRTGQPVTLLYLSYFEPETAFRCLNEILFMLTMPSMDSYFRDIQTDKLKKKFIFIVDNGPAEQPASPLVKMCLVRLLRFLQLHKAVQISFAEYHSKRNYVERVHAEENRVLSKHGIFRSNSVHSNSIAGSAEHKENIEYMAESICKCILSGSFGGNQLMCYRGVKPEDYVFQDYQQLCDFLALSEENKSNCNLKYAPFPSWILQDISNAWELDEKFTGSYAEDYKIITNKLVQTHRTSWIDKYTTAVYSPSLPGNELQLQPLPDYLRWSKCGELHYLPIEERKMVDKGVWDEMPGLFLPSHILDLCFHIMPDPPGEIINQIALLAWVPTVNIMKTKI